MLMASDGTRWLETRFFRNYPGLRQRTDTKGKKSKCEKKKQTEQRRKEEERERKKKEREHKKRKRSTGPSRVVPHRSTTPARTCLTSLFRWEAVSQADMAALPINVKPAI